MKLTSLSAASWVRGARSTSIAAAIATLLSGLAPPPAHATKGTQTPGAEEALDPARLAGSMKAIGEGLRTPVFLPLRKTEVKLDMTGAVVSAEVSQTFVNRTRTSIEAVYLFPLPSDATVTGMELRVGDRVIRSVVKERAAAKETYRAAKVAGKKTALLEQQRPNLFTTSVANVAPGEILDVRFRFMFTAAFSQGKFSLAFPLTTGPRYNPPGTSPADAERITAPLLHPTVDPGHRVSLDLAITGVPVESVVSETHPLTVEKPAGGEGAAAVTKVSITGARAKADRDFKADILIAGGTSPELSIVRSGAGGDGGPEHALLSVFPPVKAAGRPAGAAPPARDVLFLIDTSGSMNGQKIAQAKAGLRQCLEMLTEADAFTIVRFSNDFSSFAHELMAADDGNLDAARDYIDSLASGGGTQMQPALAHVLGIPGREGAVRLVVFLTDGAVGNEQSLIRLLDEQLGRARMFTFGIGHAPNEFLMRKMGEIGRGQARFIRSDQDLGASMSDFFRTLKSPVLTDVSLTWMDAAGRKLEKVRCYPDPCPDVFHARPLQVVAQLPAGFETGSVAVAGKIDGEPVEYRYEMTKGDVRKHPAIGKLFGRAQINDLMSQVYVCGDAAQRAALETSVTETALEYQLVSDYTSRVAVEEVVSRQADEPLVSGKVPVLLPKGWDAASFVATATDDGLRVLIGIAALALALGIGMWRKLGRVAS